MKLWFAARSLVCLLAVCFIFTPSKAWCDYDGSEASVHWTLAGWLAERQQMRSQDFWLALHSQHRFFDFSLTGGQENYTLDSNGASTTYWMDHDHAAISYSILGLQYDYEKSNEGWTRQSGQVDLRLFGVTQRSTYWLVSYGERKWDFTNPSDSVTNPYVSSELNLYLIRHFGINGQYRYFLKANDQNQESFEGARYQYGAFIRFRHFSVFGDYYNETTKTTPLGGVASTDTRHGYEAGGGFAF